MQPTDDRALLRQYAANNSNDAFAALVARHINLVYSVALRQAGNPQHAEEITQAVFIILAKKAAELRHDRALSSWLFRTTRLTANNFVRSEIRRQRREQEAYMRSTLNEPAGEAWPGITPLLDTAVAGLSEKDRRAILLRFYEGKNLSEVGAALGASEDTAKKRVNRAVEKLRGFFARRGVVLPAAILTAAISANSVQAAPVALAKSVTALAIAKGATASASTLTLITGALKIMAWTKAKMAIAVSACVLLTVGTVTTIMIYNHAKPVPGIPKDWSVLSGNIDQWNWADGKINARSITGDCLLASSKQYRDVTLSVIASTTNRDADIALRMQDADNGYFVLFVPSGTPWSAENGSFVGLIKRITGDEVMLASYHGRGITDAGPSAKIGVTARGPWFEVQLNGVTVLRVKDTTFSSGFIGLRICGDPKKPCDATFADLSFH